MHVTKTAHGDISGTKSGVIGGGGASFLCFQIVLRTKANDRLKAVSRVIACYTFTLGGKNRFSLCQMITMSIRHDNPRSSSENPR